MDLRIVLVSTYYYPDTFGGAEHTLQCLAEALVERGHRVTVLCLVPKERAGSYTHGGVECRALPVPNVTSGLTRETTGFPSRKVIWHLANAYNPRGADLLARQLKELQPDVVQTHNLPGWSCAAWKPARKYARVHLQVLHDFQLTCPAAVRFRNGQNCERTCARCTLFTLFSRRLSGQITNVVANSDYTRRVHRDLGFFTNSRRFEVIHGAVQGSSGGAQNYPDVNSLRIGYLGRLHPTKGIDILVEAFIAANRADAVLRIAGQGTKDYERELQLRATGFPIEFVGLQNAPSFLAQIDVLVVPSQWNEPMGRVAIEAAVQGVPVLAANMGGLPEMVRVGRTGWLFEASDVKALTVLLQQLSVSELRGMRSECQEWGRRFSPPVIAGQWEALYLKLLAELTPTRSS